jgi:tRNA wybutosine-synthesizing protein 2
MPATSFDKIKDQLTKKIPINLLKKIPDKWEKIGDVVTIVLPSELTNFKENIGETYAKFLGCKTVLNDIRGISGEYRVPNVEIIFGAKNTETVHKENGIRYKLDPQKVMFSSGNMSERVRMAAVSNSDEVVVDLFAGIGYFTLPIAVFGIPRKIFACEKNPFSYDYLCENIVLNNVTSIVEPLKGDNKKVAPRGVADRVIMGYIGNTSEFLPTAINCLKNKSGIIHFHDKFPDKLIPDVVVKIVEEEVEKHDRKVKVLEYNKIKSYAPGIGHYVFDLKIG